MDSSIIYTSAQIFITHIDFHHPQQDPLPLPLPQKKEKKRKGYRLYVVPSEPKVHHHRLKLMITQQNN